MQKALGAFPRSVTEDACAGRAPEPNLEPSPKNILLIPKHLRSPTKKLSARILFIFSKSNIALRIWFSTGYYNLI
jgi:hypothetical protein